MNGRRKDGAMTDPGRNGVGSLTWPNGWTVMTAAEKFAHAGYPLDAGAILICECDGHAGEHRCG